METKSLLFGLIGFMLGGLLVATAATTFDKPKQDVMTMEKSSSLSSLSDDEFDKAYITAMIDHHQGAIDMAKLASQRAKHTEIKTLSLEIIKAQENEITSMKQWRVNWGYPTETMNGR